MMENDETGGATIRKNRIQRKRSSFRIYVSFVDEFWREKGGWQIVVLGFLTALGIGAVVGVIPQVMTQRFADELDDTQQHIICASLMGHDTAKPKECILGGETAQTAASYNSMARNIISLLCNSVAGSYSDVHGRRGVQLLCLFLIALSPAALILIQMNRSVHPIWYYFWDSITATISFFSIAFSMLSDIMPTRHRAASFGLYTGAFFGGISIGPFFAVFMDHFQVSVFSFLVRAAAFLFAWVALPETLPPEVAAQNKEKVESLEEQGTHGAVKIMMRPFKEMLILSRSKTLILVAVGAFLSKLVFSADVSLFFYYVESNLGVQDKDVAGMLFVTGVVGLLVQAILLKYLISLLGERDLLITSFYSGVLHNLVYGLARNKAVLYIGLCLSQLTGTNGPLLSSFVSRNVDSTEQGRAQGALTALCSLAEAIGPVLINYVYRNLHVFGQGTMFVVAAMLYALGTVAISLVPPKIQIHEEADEADETGVDELTPLVTSF